MELNPIGSNQTEVSYASGARVLFSYETPVAAYVPGTGYLRTAKRHSVTTSKHINAWLAGAPAEEYPQEYFDALPEALLEEAK